jgi:transposase
MRMKGAPHAWCHLVADHVRRGQLDQLGPLAPAHRHPPGPHQRPHALRAQVPLKLGEGWSEAKVEEAFDVCRNTVNRVRARFVEGGVEAVLTDNPQERRRQALTGEQQVHLIAVACGPVPAGHDHWTLRMLAGNAVELGLVERISPETIRTHPPSASRCSASQVGSALRLHLLELLAVLFFQQIPKGWIAKQHKRVVRFSITTQEPGFPFLLWSNHGWIEQAEKT